MTDDQDQRKQAIGRLQAKRGFAEHLAIYLIVNALLVVVWAFTWRGYFWPIWPIAGWGIGVAMHGWGVFLRRPISEDDIRREMERGH